MQKYLNKKNQKGQAMVETALVLPLLVILLLGVGYFGSVITMQHNLTVAARYAARAVAVESNQNSDDRVYGTFFKSVDAAKFKKYAMRALPGFKEDRLNVQPVPELNPLAFNDFSTDSKFDKLNDYTYFYVITGKAQNSSTNISKNGDNSVSELKDMAVGVGVVYYGLRLTYRLTELDWIARLLFRKKEGITIDAVSMMPAEMPLRGGNIIGKNAGLMDINEGLFHIIRQDPNDPNEKSYVDLVPQD